MSLLMDALRKAEAEKKKANDVVQERKVTVSDSEKEKEEVDDQHNIQAMELSLKPLEAQLDETGQNSTVTDQTVNQKETASVTATSKEPATIGLDDSLYSNSNILKSEETLSSVSADQLVEDIRGDHYQPTPAAAQTVFSAGCNSLKRYSWGFFAILIVLLLSIVAIFYYFSAMSVIKRFPFYTKIESSIDLNSTQMERDAVERIQPEVDDQQLISNILESSTGNIVKENMIIAESTNDTIDNEGRSIKAVKSTTPQKTHNLVVKDKMKVKGVDKAVDIPDKIEKTNGHFPFVIDNPEQLRINKVFVTEKQNSLVREAYQAYQLGKFDEAKLFYQEALNHNESNRDVHLGFAAIAMQEGDKATAHAHYVKLLKLNPDDTLALASLVNLYRDTDPLHDISAIKLLLKKEEMPYLYFVLGLIYARELNWAEAQQAFFNAYRLDNTNSNYVLNLAISLDQLGQSVSAIDYYKMAIKLANNSSSHHFDYVTINHRINTLSKSLN